MFDRAEVLFLPPWNNILPITFWLGNVVYLNFIFHSLKACSSKWFNNKGKWLFSLTHYCKWSMYLLLTNDYLCSSLPQLMNTWELSIMILADTRLKRLSCFNNHEHIANFVLFVSKPFINCSHLLSL